MAVPGTRDPYDPGDQAATRVGAAGGIDLSPFLSQGGPVVDPREPKVFLGYQKVRVAGPNVPVFVGDNLVGKKPTMTTGRKAHVVTKQAAINLVYTDSDERNRIAKRLVAAGVLNPDYTDDQLYAAWAQYVNRASDIFQESGGKTRVSPFDLLQMAGSAPGGGPESLSPKQVVQKNYNISTPEEATSILRTVLAEALGRWPTGAELDNFTAALNSAQRANPTVTTSTTNPEGTSITQTSTGGLNPEDYARSYASRHFGEEESDYEVVSNYMPALFQALQSPV